MEVAQDELKLSYKTCRTSNTYDVVITPSHQMLRFVRTFTTIKFPFLNDIRLHNMIAFIPRMTTPHTSSANSNSFWIDCIHNFKIINTVLNFY